MDVVRGRTLQQVRLPQMLDLDSYIRDCGSVFCHEKGPLDPLRPIQIALGDNDSAVPIFALCNQLDSTITPLGFMICSPDKTQR